jgi:hypothetical protein
MARQHRLNVSHEPDTMTVASSAGQDDERAQQPVLSAPLDADIADRPVLVRQAEEAPVWAVEIVCRKPRLLEGDTQNVISATRHFKERGSGHADAPASYQARLRFTIATTESITGTSTRTPTTVASAAPEWTPNSEIAAATASSKKFDAPISAAGAATHQAPPAMR